MTPGQAVGLFECAFKIHSEPQEIKTAVHKLLESFTGSNLTNSGNAKKNYKIYILVFYCLYLFSF